MLIQEKAHFGCLKMSSYLKINIRNKILDLGENLYNENSLRAA
jgi:hypothetical protein